MKFPQQCKPYVAKIKNPQFASPHQQHTGPRILHPLPPSPLPKWRSETSKRPKQIRVLGSRNSETAWKIRSFCLRRCFGGRGLGPRWTAGARPRRFRRCRGRRRRGRGGTTRSPPRSGAPSPSRAWICESTTFSLSALSLSLSLLWKPKRAPNLREWEWEGAGEDILNRWKFFVITILSEIGCAKYFSFSCRESLNQHTLWLGEHHLRSQLVGTVQWFSGNHYFKWCARLKLPFPVLGVKYYDYDSIIRHLNENYV